MVRDRRYLSVHNLIVAGYIKTFSEIFDTLPKTVMATDLKINNNRFSFLIVHVDRFTIRQLLAIAVLLDIGLDTIWSLIITEHQKLAGKKLSEFFTSK